MILSSYLFIHSLSSSNPCPNSHVMTPINFFLFEHTLAYRATMSKLALFHIVLITFHENLLHIFWTSGIIYIYLHFLSNLVVLLHEAKFKEVVTNVFILEELRFSLKHNLLRFMYLGFQSIDLGKQMSLGLNLGSSPKCWNF